MEPFGDVVFELLDFGFDELEGFLEGVIGEVCELLNVRQRPQQLREKKSVVRGKRRSIRQQALFAFEVRFRIVNSESSAVDTQHL